LLIQYSRLAVKLREAMEAQRRRTGVRVTYETLAEQTGISVATLQSLSTRAGYNTRLSTIARLCRALECGPGDLLVLLPEDAATS
jgi:DNA-binding Xre family transcriptional regulator